MSVSGIFSSTFVNYSTQYSQQVQQEFQQLGQDLESGNLSAAKTDFATLQQLVPQSGATSPTQTSDPLAQNFNQLAQDLKSGNLSAAQQDYAKLGPSFPRQASTPHHHHHHGGGGETNTISQLFQQLGQQLQSGSLSGAQQAYSTLMQDFQQFDQNGGGPSTTALPTSSNNVSLIA